jgi:glutathione S-transferase
VDIVLHQWEVSPFCGKVRRILKAKGVAYRDESLYWYEVHFRARHDAVWTKTADLMCNGRPAYERMLFGWIGRKKFMDILTAQGIGRQPIEQVEERFWMLMAQLNTSLADRAWLVGDQLSLADIAVGSQLHEIARTMDIAPQLAALPHLKRWVQKI